MWLKVEDEGLMDRTRWKNKFNMMPAATPDDRTSQRRKIWAGSTRKKVFSHPYLFSLFMWGRCLWPIVLNLSAVSSPWRYYYVLRRVHTTIASFDLIYSTQDSVFGPATSFTVSNTYSCLPCSLYKIIKIRQRLCIRCHSLCWSIFV